MANSDLAEVWARSLDGLADLQIQPHQRAWLKLTRPLGLVENTALIATPNEFVKEQLETRLRALVTQALSQQLGRDIQLAVTVDPAPQATMPGSGTGQDLSPETPEPPAPRLQGVGDLDPRPAAPHSHPVHDGDLARGPRRRTRTRRTTAGCTTPASTPARIRAVPEGRAGSSLPPGSAAPG